jgi:hypothetical protein
MLREESGISDEVIAARGYHTITDHKELTALGFSSKQLRVPGLSLPLHTTDGSQPFCVYRPDSPRELSSKIIKYEIPKGHGIRLDCPSVCRAMLANPSVPLWITEGQKKADSLASHGACAVALLGVWNFKGKNAFGGVTFLADFDHIALNSREVRIVFDNDMMRKSEVRKACERLTEHLQRKGAHVSTVYLPLDGPKGVDEYLASGKTLSDLEALLEAPHPQPKPAPLKVELLDNPPLTMRRPLALIAGRAYAATWLYVKETKTEGTDKAGNVVKLNPPEVTTSQRLFIVRDDGRVFGPGGDEPLNALDLTVSLPEIPRQDRLFSTRAVNAYRTGTRPDPTGVFKQIVTSVDRFLDFDCSLASQQTMCELIACYTLATWFLDAFTVAGFLWPNGDWGSGKTKLLIVTTELSYLGQVILAGGSFAALRDLADYGAALAFDDAEKLADPKKSDPDKRELLLAGNRKGSTIPVKEPGPDRTWRTRYVNTFCPRLFSATHLPDNILASRTIIVPLVRTSDKLKANSDPLDSSCWPCDRRQLVDYLWSLALFHLPFLPTYEARVNKESTLLGRHLEPWRALLAVALWLQDLGVEGLFQRMHDLATKYTLTERPNLEIGNLTTLIIKALLQCTETSIKSITSVSSVKKKSQKSENAKRWTLTTTQITEAVKAIAEQEEADIAPEFITARRIGRSLARLRLTKDPDTSKRAWSISFTDLVRLAVSFGLVPSSSAPPEEPSVTHEEKNKADTQDVNAWNAENAGNACPTEGPAFHNHGREAWETEL